MLLPPTIQRADFALKLWSHVQDSFKHQSDILRDYALKFFDFSRVIETTPSILRKTKDNEAMILQDDLSLSERINLLLDWWEASGNDEFMNKGLELLSENYLEVVSWWDGQPLPQIHQRVYSLLDVNHPLRGKLLEAITDQLIEIIDNGVPIDELIEIIRSIQEHMADFNYETVDGAIAYEVYYHLSETKNTISCLDSEQSLHEHLEYLENLARLTGINTDRAQETVLEKLNNYEEQDHGEHRPSFSRSGGTADGEFSNEAIRSLFGSLL
ncbi:MAG: hypothetical protein F4244_09225 [Gammaproteobacteria bacterium]|nr:hypothetical protein [Gammaproteobacteria bacterium]